MLKVNRFLTRNGPKKNVEFLVNARAGTGINNGTGLDSTDKYGDAADTNKYGEDGSGTTI